MRAVGWWHVALILAMLAAAFGGERHALEAVQATDKQILAYIAGCVRQLTTAVSLGILILGFHAFVTADAAQRKGCPKCADKTQPDPATQPPKPPQSESA